LHIRRRGNSTLMPKHGTRLEAKSERALQSLERNPKTLIDSQSMTPM